MTAKELGYMLYGALCVVIGMYLSLFLFPKVNPLKQYDSALCDMYRGNQVIESWQYKSGTWSPYTDETVQAPMSKVK